MSTPTRPEGMSDEMWAAVQIVMEDEGIKSYKEMTAAHQAAIERMDQMETKWSERDAAWEAKYGKTDDGTSGATNQPTGESVGGGTGGTPPMDSDAPTPPPVVEPSTDEPKGSGRGGRKRWYEHEGYAK